MLVPALLTRMSSRSKVSSVARIKRLTDASSVTSVVTAPAPGPSASSSFTASFDFASSRAADSAALIAMSAHVIIGACRLGMVARTGIMSSPLPRPRWRGALRRAPRPMHRAHLWGQHVLPPRPHDTIDPQLKENFGRVGHVLRVPQDCGTRRRILYQKGLACNVELVASGLRLGKCLQGVPAVPSQVVLLRRRGCDQNKEVVAGPHRAHRMKARGAIPAHRREKGQPYAKLIELGAPGIRQLGLGGSELGPRDHRNLPGVTDSMITRGGSGSRDSSLLAEIQVVAPGSYGTHGLEAVLYHVAVQLHAIPVGVGKIHTPRHVVLDRGLDRHPHRLQLSVRGLQLLEAPELPRHAVQTGWCGSRRLAPRHLEQRQIVVLLAEAEEHRSPLRVLVGHPEAQGPGVKVLRLGGVADVQHEVTELLCLNHVPLPPPEASTRGVRPRVASPIVPRYAAACFTSPARRSIARTIAATPVRGRSNVIHSAPRAPTRRTSDATSATEP